MVMNQKQLQYFLDCCETKNMQKTADRLFVSRQGVSKMIRDLETELGTPLFHRSQKGLEPTDFAFSLIPHARNLLDEYACITGMNTLAGQKQNVVTLYALDHVLEYLSADFLRDFRKAFPHTILSTVESTDTGALNGLLAQEADFAITTGPIDSTRFTAGPLFYSRFCFRMAADHPLARKEKLTYQDLAGQKIISKGRAYRCFRTHMDEKILGAGIAVDIFAETSDETIALDLIRKEGVISIGYDYMDLLHPAPDIAVRPLDASESGSELYLVTLKNTLPRKSARQFRQFLLDWIPAHGKDQIAWPEAQYSTVSPSSGIS